jgi:hypothetical protein
MTNSELQTSLEVLKEFGDGDIFFGEIPDISLIKKDKMLSAPHGRKTWRALNGRFIYLRNWHGIRFGFAKIYYTLLSLLHKNPTTCLGRYKLPDDAIVFAKEYSLVICSKKENKVIKIEWGLRSELWQKTTIKAYTAFVDAGMGQHTSKILNYGKASSSIHYCSFEFSPNRHPLFRTLHGENWSRNFKEKVLPVILKFHLKNGLELVDGSGWKALIEDKLSERKLPEHLYNACMKDLFSLDSATLKNPICMISGDLQPQNIHFFGNQLKILDWSNMRNASLMIDVFAEVTPMAIHHIKPTPEKITFWKYLSGEIELNQTSAKVRKTIENWQGLMENDFNTTIDEKMLRLSVRGMCWDWLVTKDHLYDLDGTPWRKDIFPASFLNSAGKT